MKKFIYLFGELTDDDLDWIIASGKAEWIPTGTVLIQEGEPIAAFYLLLEGSLKVLVKGLGNPEIAVLTGGEIVGEMSLVDSRHPSATVVAAEDSLILCLDRNKLAKKLKFDVGFASRFYRAIALFLSTRLRGTVTQLGYGQNLLLTEDDSTLDLIPETVENQSLAETRFDWLLRHFKIQQHPSKNDPAS